MFSFLCFTSISLLSLSLNVLGREIVFPPLSAIGPNGKSPSSYSQGIKEDLLFEDREFAGLSTFANLPYVHCTSASKNVESYDIAFLGAPFDTVRSDRMAGCLLKADGIQGNDRQTWSSLWPARYQTRLDQNATRVCMGCIYRQ